MFPMASASDENILMNTERRKKQAEEAKAIS